MRAAFFLLLALAVLAADLLCASWLAGNLVGPGSGGGESALAPRPFPLFSSWFPNVEGVLFLHAVAAGFGSLFLSVVPLSPTARDLAARWFLLFALSLPLPGVGFALAFLVTTALLFSKKRPDNDALFCVGNPLADPVTGSMHKPALGQEPLSAIPLSARIRGGDLDDLRSLAIGLRGLPLGRTGTVLERLQRDPDTYLQLYAQGDAAEAAEIEESRLRSLENYVGDHPGDERAKTVLADHLHHLAAAPHVTADQSAHYLDRALGHLEGLHSPRAIALRIGICIRKKDPATASKALEALAASDTGSDSDPVKQTAAASLVAEFLHLTRRWGALRDLLGSSEIAAEPSFDPVRRFFAVPAPNRSSM